MEKEKFQNKNLKCLALCKGEDIHQILWNVSKKDSQYIAKEAVKMLKRVCENTYTTTGQITRL